ncbi:MAG: PEGA domain-containing protein [Sandaracinaceae bacterium]|nr:PEGA domain-containing protein [Sandaracinaceae bacterium]
MMRTHAAATAVLLVLLSATAAGAQDAEPAPAEPAAQAEAPPVEAVTTQAVTAPTPAHRYARPRPAPPIMVVALPGDRVEAEVAAAARDALVAQITPMAGGRAVHGLANEQLMTALAACDSDTCIGGLLASAGAQAGVLLRLVRRGRDLQGTLELRDPVSGTLRIEAAQASLPPVANELATPLLAMTAQIARELPAGPAGPASLLVTTTADGALVTVDGEDIGQSPVGPIDIADGEHEVIVRLTGYQSYRVSTRIAPGGRARVDATLRTIGDDGSGGGSSDVFGQDGGGGGDDDLLGQWWFWTIVGGGAAILIAVAIGIGVAVADSNSQPAMPGQPMGIPLPPITGGM